MQKLIINLYDYNSNIINNVMGRWNNLKKNMPVSYLQNFMLEEESCILKFMLLRNLFRKPFSFRFSS